MSPNDRQGRPHGGKNEYEVQIGDENLAFRMVEIADPVVTGRQIVNAAGLRPVEEYVTFAMLGDSALEEIRLDETFDLRGKGAEKVVVMKADATYRIFLDGREFSWKKVATGRVLKQLAGVDPARHDLYREVRGGDDVLIRNDDLVDLSAPGVEKFFTAVAQTTEGLAPLLPPRDTAYLADRGLAHEVVEVDGQRAVVLTAFPLPEGRFNVPTADILVMLPPGYPDCAPDMFFCIPALVLQESGREARATQVRQTFAGRTWQRWSRHNHEWRPGIDGLSTMIKRIERALAEAA